MTATISLGPHLRPENRAARLFFGYALLISFIGLCGTNVLAQEPAPAASSLSAGRRFDERGGAAIYARVCAACHQPDAQGAVGAGSYPALAENKNLASTEYLENVLLNGLRGMPPIGRMMSDEQVADVINYVRSHFGNSYDDPVAATDVQAARPK
jgi:mono/diheme cytochrome c family protein